MPPPTTLPVVTTSTINFHGWNGLFFFSQAVEPDDLAPLLALGYDYRQFRAPEATTWKQSGTGRLLPQEVTLALRVAAGSIGAHTLNLSALELSLANALHVSVADEAGNPMLYRRVVAIKTFGSNQRYQTGGSDNRQVYLMSLQITLGNFLAPLVSATAKRYLTPAGNILLVGNKG